MDMNLMTQKVNEALTASQTLAVRLSHQEVDGEHLLAELLAQDNGLAARLIEQAGIAPDAFKAKVLQKTGDDMPNCGLIIYNQYRCLRKL